MKKLIAACAVGVLAQSALAADSAGLVGILNTSGTVTVNNFVNPRDVWTVYQPNDPSEQAYILAYLAYRREGRHQASIEWTDQAGKPIDRCVFDATTVTELPWIHTVTCKWGGRLPSGGLNFTVYDTFGGKKQRVGGMFLPAKQP